MKGDPEPVKKLWSHKEDVSSANPHGPPVRGWDEVALALEHAASLRSEGEFLGYEVVAKVVTPELAYVARIERAQAKIGASEEITPFSVRSTMIFRAEDGMWKALHAKVNISADPEPSVAEGYAIARDVNHPAAAPPFLPGPTHSHWGRTTEGPPRTPAITPP